MKQVLDGPLVATVGAVSGYLNEIGPASGYSQRFLNSADALHQTTKSFGSGFDLSSPPKTFHYSGPSHGPSCSLPWLRPTINSSSIFSHVPLPEAPTMMPFKLH